MEKQSISLCIITKNEEANLKNCLNSAYNIVDEIIIVDTGSADKTKEIAKEFNAKIFDFTWAEDFSAARNESLKHATKDWILVLDADEIIDGRNAKNILETINDAKNDAYFILQKNFTSDSSISGFVPCPHHKDGNNYDGFFGSLIIRLFKNKKNFNFAGTVHELVENSVFEASGKVSSSNISINNYGNSDRESLNKKMEFYLRLCKNKVKINPSSNSYQELGILFKQTGKLDDAKRAFEQSLIKDPKNVTALLELGILSENKKKYDEAIKYYSECIKIKKSSTAYQKIGICLAKKGMLKEAKISLEEAISQSPNSYKLYNSLGSVLEKMGELGAAFKALKTSIKLNPNNKAAFYNIGIVLDKAGKNDIAIKSYEEAIKLGHQNKDNINERIEKLKKS
jgi:tetratricopeptide (TPR) repeat protein